LPSKPDKWVWTRASIRRTGEATTPRPVAAASEPGSRRESLADPDKDIADYYTANSGAYEEVELERLYVPRAQQLEAPKEKMTPEETQKRQQDAQAVMKKEAADLRARAAAGEDIAKLQEEAYKTAGFKIAPPPTKMEKHRRSSLPPARFR